MTAPATDKPGRDIDGWLALHAEAVAAHDVDAMTEAATELVGCKGAVDVVDVWS